MDDTPLPRLLIGYAVLFALPLTLILFPRSGWRRGLTRAVGPVLDPRLLNRGQCLWNAATYAVMGITAMAAAILTGSLADWWFAPKDPPQPFLVLSLAYFLLGLLGLVAAIYLIAYAPFRPHTLPREPAALDVQLLKQYESSDRSYTVLIGITPEEKYLVLVPARVIGDDPLEPVALGPFDRLEEAEREARAASGHPRGN